MTWFVAVIFAFGIFQQPAPADSISLQYCYEKAADNYPTAKNIDLQEKVTELNVSIANTGYYPDVSVNGKASYQSEVTDFSLPGGSGPPPISKDQYEASLNVVQNIFSGGAVGIRKDLERARGQQEIHSTEVELHQIRSQIDQVFYGILLSQQQSKTNDLFLKDLYKRLETVRSQVKNGVLLPSQERILKAELIKARQDSAEIQSNVRAGYQVLSEIIGEDITAGVELKLPELRVDLQSMQPRRPEYDLFESSRSTIEQQKKLANSRKLPNISAYGTAAYGRPGFNFMNDDFHDYYMVGVRLRWDFWDFLNSDREQQVLNIQQSKITQNQRAFTNQLNSKLHRINERIITIRENIDRDQEIIDLRNRIVEESASQLKNGVITATEYVTELNRARRARLSLFTNQVRLIQAQTEYATALGVPLEQARN